MGVWGYGKGSGRCGVGNGRVVSGKHWRCLRDVVNWESGWVWVHPYYIINNN